MKIILSVDLKITRIQNACVEIQIDVTKVHIRMSLLPFGLLKDCFNRISGVSWNFEGSFKAS